MKFTAKTITPYSGEAKTYSLSNYPGVKLHWKCNETGGTDWVDEVHGVIIRPNQSSSINGTISFGSPTYTVDPECVSSPNTPILGGSYPTFDGSKFILSFAVARCTTTLSGRVSIGEFSADTPSGPGIALSMVNGIHFFVTDNASVSISPSDISTLTSGTDYILAAIIRPSGGTCEGTVYTSTGIQTGTVLYTVTALNPGLGLITPNAFQRPTGLAFYQWIVYQFSSEPSDLLTGMKWHTAMAMSGIKAPYPAWKYKT